jgi:serine/threonine-protein kinase
MAINGRLDSTDSVLQTFRRIASAVQHLHQLGIAHGDLKLHNILMDKEGNPKLTDFGCGHTTLFAGDDRKAGTIEYIAPELLTAGRFYTQKADIWAVGIRLCAMATQEFPFDLNLPICNQIVAGRLYYGIIIDRR